jgi:hypothetical protein
LTAAFLALPPTKRRLIGLVRRDINLFQGEARADLVHAYQAALPEVVEAILRDGVRDGELVPCDARLLSWQFVAVIEVLLSPYADARFATADDKLDYALSTFFFGCSHTPAGTGGPS